MSKLRRSRIIWLNLSAKGASFWTSLCVSLLCTFTTAGPIRRKKFFFRYVLRRVNSIELYYDREFELLLEVKQDMVSSTVEVMQNYSQIKSFSIFKTR
ncbi:unnamed protein product [Rhizophagus irregularis]|nr:unnamed protein product [Rhizophagus irregularis]